MIDASMVIYQSLIGTMQYRSTTGLTELKDNNGNPTAHLGGIISKTIHYMEAGIKPVWVFDGKPPEEK